MASAEQARACHLVVCVQEEDEAGAVTGAASPVRMRADVLCDQSEVLRARLDAPQWQRADARTADGLPCVYLAVPPGWVRVGEALLETMRTRAAAEGACAAWQGAVLAHRYAAADCLALYTAKVDAAGYDAVDPPVYREPLLVALVQAGGPDAVHDAAVRVLLHATARDPNIALPLWRDVDADRLSGPTCLVAMDVLGHAVADQPADEGQPDDQMDDRPDAQPDDQMDDQHEEDRQEEDRQLHDLLEHQLERVTQRLRASILHMDEPLYKAWDEWKGAPRVGPAGTDLLPTLLREADAALTHARPSFIELLFGAPNLGAPFEEDWESALRDLFARHAARGLGPAGPLACALPEGARLCDARLRERGLDAVGPVCVEGFEDTPVPYPPAPATRRNLPELGAHADGLAACAAGLAWYARRDFDVDQDFLRRVLAADELAADSEDTVLHVVASLGALLQSVRIRRLSTEEAAVLRRNPKRFTAHTHADEATAMHRALQHMAPAPPAWASTAPRAARASVLCSVVLDAAGVARLMADGEQHALIDAGECYALATTAACQVALRKYRAGDDVVTVRWRLQLRTFHLDPGAATRELRTKAAVVYVGRSLGIRAAAMDARVVLARDKFTPITNVVAVATALMPALLNQQGALPLFLELTFH